ncbi:MAG: helix-turn-helix domain-containing protein [Phycisphaerales bacterium]|nr:MAG: helix-turn-helix domain-containing protein [Phycisphaerales bacterium]
MSDATPLPVSADTTDALMRRLLLTREQVAELLGVPESSVDYMHRVKRLRAVRVGGHNRWKPAALKDFVDQLEPED